MPIALVADNDPGVRTLLADLVRRGGFEVRTAIDGSSAREQLEAGDVDLLVCDLDMPGLSGQQLLAWVALLPRPPQVVVVSGFVDGSIERELGTYLFVRAVLRKPFDVFGFVQRLRELAKAVAPTVPEASGLVPPTETKEGTPVDPPTGDLPGSGSGRGSAEGGEADGAGAVPPGGPHPDRPEAGAAEAGES